MTNLEKANYHLEEMISDSDTPGLQYMVVSSDSTIFEFNSGISNLEDSISYNSATTINTFSVTKTFTSLAVLQLEENKKLSIDDNVQNYLEDLPYQSDFTIRQLLNHTSGLPNPMPLKWAHLLKEHENFDYKEFVKTVLSKNNELDNEPGEKYAYSNIGYLLLGELIEKVSGEEYKSYVTNNIIKKLSLADDAYLGFLISDTLKHAHGYIKKWSFINFGLNFVFDKGKFMQDTYDGWTQFNYYYMYGYPFGGLIGNARGFAMYLTALLKDNVLITPESKFKLFQDQKTSDGEIIDQSLGWFRGKMGEETYFTHAGGGAGYYCEIRIYPEIQMASVIMFNRTGVSDERILDDIDKYFIPHQNE